ncbi:hypothetical protein FLAT13_01504 [Flavobacterium salmonis]|uniref:Uncharacterized protein n=2 Tax=Flavobacterium salmonis TaxID=2654844 RepID=A0A6V6YV37_9FLAO|nr:hypothetical protein FLAT13_01504 [Flavobacterium salmonis]
MKTLYSLIFFICFLSCNEAKISENNNCCDCVADFKTESTIYAKNVSLKIENDKTVLIFKCVSMQNSFMSFSDFVQKNKENTISNEIECISKTNNSLILSKNFDYSTEEMKYMEITKEGAQDSFLTEIKKNDIEILYMFKLNEKKEISSVFK